MATRTLAQRAGLVAAAIATSALVQAQGVPPPPRLEPIPELPPPAIGIDADTTSDRGVRLSPGTDDRVDEVVIDGKRTVRVTNANGTEYYLVEDLGDGTVTGQNAQDSRFRAPRWLILQF
ncbi:MAG: DUF2782 domain-containing protein [Burkholderiales bacterium]